MLDRDWQDFVSNVKMILTCPFLALWRMLCPISVVVWNWLHFANIWNSCVLCLFETSGAFWTIFNWEKKCWKSHSLSSSSCMTMGFYGLHPPRTSELAMCFSCPTLIHRLHTQKKPIPHYQKPWVCHHSFTFPERLSSEPFNIKETTTLH